MLAHIDNKQRQLKDSAYATHITQSKKRRNVVVFFARLILSSLHNLNRVECRSIAHDGALHAAVDATVVLLGVALTIQHAPVGRTSGRYQTQS